MRVLEILVAFVFAAGGVQALQLEQQDLWMKFLSWLLDSLRVPH
jgi:hypothetical protein